MRLAACTASTEGCLCWSASIFAWARTSQFRLLLDNQLQTHLLPLPIRKIAAFFEACHFASHRSHQSHNCTVCCLLIFRIGWMSLIPAYFSVRVLLREKLVFELSQLNVHFLLRPTAIQPRLLTFPSGDVYSLSLHFLNFFWIKITIFFCSKMVSLSVIGANHHRQLIIINYNDTIISMLYSPIYS